MGNFIEKVTISNYSVTESRQSADKKFFLGKISGTTENGDTLIRSFVSRTQPNGEPLTGYLTCYPFSITENKKFVIGVKKTIVVTD